MITDNSDPILETKEYKEYLELKKKRLTCFACLKEIKNWSEEGMLMPSLVSSSGGIWIHQKGDCFQKGLKKIERLRKEPSQSSTSGNKGGKNGTGL